MTETETAKIIALLREYYPRDIESTDIKTKVKAWHMILGGYTYQESQAAVLSFASTDIKGFAPSVGQLVDIIAKLRSPNEMTDLEAWDLVQKAVCNSAYHAEREFAKLPEAIQRTIGSHNMLRQWAALNETEFQTVVMSGFRKSYAARTNSDKEYAKLPEVVRQTITGLSERLMMPGKKGDE